MIHSVLDSMHGRRRPFPNLRSRRFVPSVYESSTTYTHVLSFANHSHQLQYIVHQTGNGISDELAQIVGGVSKVFVGLIVSKGTSRRLQNCTRADRLLMSYRTLGVLSLARMVQQSLDQTGPLTPAHLREAHRLYILESGKGYGLTGRRPGVGTKNKKGLFVQ